jgi:hypothetical protein
MPPSIREQNQALQVALHNHAAYACMLRTTLKDICMALVAERADVYPVDPGVLAEILRSDLDEYPTESIPLRTVKALQVSCNLLNLSHSSFLWITKYKSPCSRIAPILILEKKNILELYPLQARGNLRIFYDMALDDFISKRGIRGPVFMSLFGPPPSFPKHAINVLVERDPGQLEYFGVYYIYGQKDRITDFEWKFGDPKVRKSHIALVLALW